MSISGTSDGAQQIPAATSSNRSPALGLNGPVKASHLRIGVPARAAALVLDVVSSVVAAFASGVGVLTPETETGCTLGH